jgi:hypothetical protein
VGRPATSGEIARAKDYLSHYESALRDAIATANTHTIPRRSVDLALVESESTGKNAPKRPGPPQNPDEVVPVEEAVKEEVIEAADPKTAAWASFCQALLGSAEFRYIK